jgi:hypothetical protein
VVTAAAALAAGVPVWAQGPVPQGQEFRVNTFTTDTQIDPAVAMDADGDFVVVWTSGGPSGAGQDGASDGVYGQRYDAGGAPLGEEFRVNTFTTNSQSGPAVAMDADGDFVVAWHSGFQEGNWYEIYAQRYDAAGVPQGAEFRVNTHTTSSQLEPAVAMDADGDFVVAWQSFQQDGNRTGIYAQRYDAAGVPLGLEFQVNTHTTGYQSRPAVGMDADGDFVVAWDTESETPGSFYDVYGQRYAAAGVPQGGEFRVNAATTNWQSRPAVGMDAGGDFVVVWASNRTSNGGWGAFAQRYDAAGVPVGAEFRATSSASHNQFPGVGMDADGDFVVASYSDGEDGSFYGVYAQQYDAEGSPRGPEFRVNTYTMGNQTRPAVGMDADGDFVVVWTGQGADDSSSSGVYGQRYAAGSVAVEPGTAAGLSLSVAPSPVVGSVGRVRYAVPETGRVRLAAYDVLGREVAVLADGVVGVGAHEAALEASALPAGVYVLRLEAGGEALVRRVSVAR